VPMPDDGDDDDTDEQTTQVCPTCNGRGRTHDGLTCRTCGGSGRIPIDNDDDDSDNGKRSMAYEDDER
jgi:hypothetical protein